MQQIENSTENLDMYINFYPEILVKYKGRILNSFEVSPVRILDDGEGKTGCEVCDPEDANMWSIYIRIQRGGSQCIADCNNEATANILVQSLAPLMPDFENMDELIRTTNNLSSMLYKLEIIKSIHGKEKTALLKIAYRDGNEIKQLQEQQYIKIWENETPTLQAVAYEISINDWSRWNKSLQQGKPIEVSEYIYYHMLECLPPRNWDTTTGYFEVGEPHHHENGIPIHRAFWMWEGKFFTGHPKSFTTSSRRKS